MLVKTNILPVKTKGSNQLIKHSASIVQHSALSGCIKCFYFESLVICCQARECLRLPILNFPASFLLVRCCSDISATTNLTISSAIVWPAVCRLWHMLTKLTFLCTYVSQWSQISLNVNTVLRCVTIKPRKKKEKKNTWFLGQKLWGNFPQNRIPVVSIFPS